FLDKIKEMLEEETNAMVLANCISALIEISTTKGKDILEINWSYFSNNLIKLFNSYQSFSKRTLCYII
ncbi:hypothetical protein II654_01735, partial [bacterium]|nr:hypothetical protein [bacterium]